MVEQQSLLDQQIIKCLNTYYGIKVETLTRLPLGADMNASVYRADAYNKSSYFIKLRHGYHQDISATILALLHDVGIRQIILPIKSNRGGLVLHMDNFTLTVFPFVKGQDGFHRALTNDQWIMLGKVMRQIHEVDVPRSVQAVIRYEDYSTKWQHAVRSLYTHIESELKGDDIALMLIDFMKQHSVTIHRLVDRAEQLSQIIQSKLPEYVLCHSDIHGGNVLIDGSDIIYLVDWDDPIMAPKERDLMFIGGGIANVWNKSHEEELFYEGYGKTDINTSILAYYRHERIVEDIALLGQQLLLTSTGGQSRVEFYQHFIAQFEPQGVVEIAFKTDESLRSKCW